MSTLISGKFDLGAESRDEAQVSVEALGKRASSLQQQLETVTDPDQSAALRLQLAALQLEMERGNVAWPLALESFHHHAQNHNWTEAVQALDLLFRCEQPDSLVALGHAVWLSVTFPMDPALTVSQLQHIVDETPDESDGAAIAAATAAYVAELRRDQGDDDVDLAVSQMLSQVAREHGGITEQDQFDPWFTSLELDQPEKFLVRLRNVIDVLVQDDWWIDREALQAKLPH